MSAAAFVKNGIKKKNLVPTLLTCHMMMRFLLFTELKLLPVCVSLVAHQAEGAGDGVLLWRKPAQSA